MSKNQYHFSILFILILGVLGAGTRECPFGEYWQGGETGRCVQCLASCAMCTSIISPCSLCPPTQKLMGQVCQNCQVGMLQCGEELSRCWPGYVLNNEICSRPCPQNCHSCTQFQTCSQCNEGQRLQQGICVSARNLQINTNQFFIETNNNQNINPENNNNENIIPQNVNVQSTNAQNLNVENFNGNQISNILPQEFQFQQNQIFTPQSNFEFNNFDVQNVQNSENENLANDNNPNINENFNQNVNVNENVNVNVNENGNPNENENTNENTNQIESTNELTNVQINENQNENNNLNIVTNGNENTNENVNTQTNIGIGLQNQITNSRTNSNNVNILPLVQQTVTQNTLQPVRPDPRTIILPLSPITPSLSEPPTSPLVQNSEIQQNTENNETIESNENTENVENIGNVEIPQRTQTVNNNVNNENNVMSEINETIENIENTQIPINSQNTEFTINSNNSVQNNENEQIIGNSSFVTDLSENGNQQINGNIQNNENIQNNGNEQINVNEQNNENIEFPQNLTNVSENNVSNFVVSENSENFVQNETLIVSPITNENVNVNSDGLGIQNSGVIEIEGDNNMDINLPVIIPGQQTISEQQITPGPQVTPGQQQNGLSQNISSNANETVIEPSLPNTTNSMRQNQQIDGHEGNQNQGDGEIIVVPSLPQTPSIAQSQNQTQQPQIPLENNQFFCEQGFYADKQGNCQRCQQICKSCYMYQNLCLQCAQGYKKYGWKCIKSKNFDFRIELAPINSFANVSQTSQSESNISLGLIIEELKSQIIKNLLPQGYTSSRSITLSSVSLQRGSISQENSQSISQGNSQGVVLEGTIEEQGTQEQDQRLGQEFMKEKLQTNGQIGGFRIVGYSVGQGNSTTVSDQTQPAPSIDTSSDLPKILIPSIIGGLIILSFFSIMLCYCCEWCCFTPDPLYQQTPTMLTGRTAKQEQYPGRIQKQFVGYQNSPNSDRKLIENKPKTTYTDSQVGYGSSMSKPSTLSDKVTVFEFVASPNKPTQAVINNVYQSNLQDEVQKYKN